MANFTPQEIEQFLQEFFDVVGARQYIGARYVPIFGRAGEDTVEWDDGAPYEPLTVVMHEGVSYVSRRYVPTGIQVTDTDYWVETYRYNAQVEQYRQEVLGFQSQIDRIRRDMESDYVPFPDSETYPKYGTTGQVLTTLTNGKTNWEDPVTVDAEVAEPLIEEWLDTHPEATTTVQDNSLTTTKFRDNTILDDFLANGPEQIKARVFRDSVWQQLIVDAMNVERINLTDATFVEGQYVNYDDTIATNPSLSYCEYIEIPKGAKSLVTPRFVIGGSTRYDRSGQIFIYDADQTLIAYSTTNYGDLQIMPVPANARYFRCNFSSASGTRIVCASYYDALKFNGYVASATEDLDDYTSTGIYLAAIRGIVNAPDNSIGLLEVIKSEYNNYCVQKYYDVYTAKVFYRFTSNLTVWSEWVSTSDSALLMAAEMEIEASVIKETTLYLTANKQYYIEVETQNGRNVNLTLWAGSDNSNYRLIRPDMRATHYTPQYDGYLKFYCVFATDTYNIKVYDAERLRLIDSDKNEIFYVKNETHFEYRSLTRLFMDLKETMNKKTVYVYPGTYNIYQEYVNANVPVYTGTNPAMDYWDYCVFVPTNTHLIGMGDVKLDWMPNPATDDITPNQCKCVSPLNTAGDCIIENVTIRCKNGRYCIHDDTLGKAAYLQAHKVFKSVRTIKYANDSSGGESYGFAHNVGFGSDGDQVMRYEDCVFENQAYGWAFYGHTRYTSEYGNRADFQWGFIDLIRCILNSNNPNGAVKFGNGDDSGNYRVKVRFESCYIGGAVNLINEGATTPARKNKYECVSLCCNPLTYTIADTDNPYTPVAYNVIGA